VTVIISLCSLCHC